MKVTGHGDEGRKLHNGGYPQKVSVEPRGYAGAPDRGKMTENNATNTDGQTDRLLEKILNKHRPIHRGETIPQSEPGEDESGTY